MKHKMLSEEVLKHEVVHNLLYHFSAEAFYCSFLARFDFSPFWRHLNVQVFRCTGFSAQKVQTDRCKKGSSKSKSKDFVFGTGTEVFLKQHFLAKEPNCTFNLNGCRLKNNGFFIRENDFDFNLLKGNVEVLGILDLIWVPWKQDTLVLSWYPQLLAQRVADSWYSKTAWRVSVFKHGAWPWGSETHPGVSARRTLTLVGTAALQPAAPPQGAWCTACVSF